MIRPFFILLLLVSAGSPIAFSQPQESAPFVVTGYLGGRFHDFESYRFDQLSEVNYSFVRLHGDRLGGRGERAGTAIARLVSLKQQFPGLKVVVSFGGWGGCESCSEIFSTAAGRTAFADSTKEFLERFGLDGIDLDWEFPAIEGYPGHRYAPEDRHNFTLLVRELRRVLGNRYELTFAAGAFDQYLTQSVEWDQIVPLVDRINLMTYDLVNGFSTRTGHQTPLYSTKSQNASTDHAVKVLDSIGVPRGKIVIGAAFYARVWKDVPGVNNGLYQPGTFDNFVTFRDMDSYWKSHPGFVSYWDSTAHAPYAYNAAEKLFATFDDRRSVSEKTAYALREGLGGIMFWELSGDIAKDGLLHSIDSTRIAGSRPR